MLPPLSQGRAAELPRTPHRSLQQVGGGGGGELPPAGVTKASDVVGGELHHRCHADVVDGGGQGSDAGGT